MFFANIAALVFMNSWLATILLGLGIPAGLAIVIAASTNAGGILGGIVISELCDRFDSIRFLVLATCFVLGAAAIAGIAYAGDNTWLAFFTTFLVGFFTYGAQNTANAVAATIYPTAMRSTGAGWAIGIGNSAQIVSPLLGGYLLTLNWPAPTILSTIAIPAVVAALAAFQIGRTKS
jgi:AAHS family 4-hydroxybenzoate transporter-like MFS transporter